MLNCLFGLSFPCGIAVFFYDSPQIDAKQTQEHQNTLIASGCGENVDKRNINDSAFSLRSIQPCQQLTVCVLTRSDSASWITSPLIWNPPLLPSAPFLTCMPPLGFLWFSSSSTAPTTSLRMACRRASPTYTLKLSRSSMISRFSFSMAMSRAVRPSGSMQLILILK